MSQDFNVVLRVDVIQAQGLAAKDRNGLSDPYVVVTIGDVTYQTQVINKNLSPRWDASFDTSLNSQNPPSDILFTCWDKDVFGKDFLGEVKVPLQQHWKDSEIGYNAPGNKPKWYALENTSRPKETISGEISIRIGLIDPDNKFIEAQELASIWQRLTKLDISEHDHHHSHDTTTPSNGSIVPNENYYGHGNRPSSITSSSTTFSSSSGNSNTLGLTYLELVRAEDLPPEKAAVGSKFDMDPFVIISFSKQTFRTRTIQHCLNPSWNEKLYFLVKQHESNFFIKFSVYDEDKVTFNDLIADCQFPIQALIAEANNNQLPRTISEGMVEYVMPLELRTKTKYDNLPKLWIRGKFIPLEHLRRQFWIALSKTYDSDENGVLNFIEISTMLSSFGSLTDKSIEGFFMRYNKDPRTGELTFEELCECLEQRLLEEEFNVVSTNGEESLIILTDCPYCHKPDLQNCSVSEIITHLSVCASTNWDNVNKFIVGDFITESQAQRKWVSKVISKVGYGSFRVGAVIQDRVTGQLVEEKMPTYIRLGIRLLYKGKPNKVEMKSTKRLLETLSIKQGKKYDAPSSVNDIASFIEFHQLNIHEILDPLDSFKSFNEFFYRKLKPSARELDSPNDSSVLVSPADCRMMAFSTIDEATTVWIKGQNFSLEGLLRNQDAAAQFHGGSLGIFRLAPQDYHRFHFPVDGLLSEPLPIKGAYYTVNPMAIRSELDVYGENKRVVSYIESPHFGRVAYVSIGAMMVGSIEFTSTPHSHVKRLEEHGYFAFGGSTVILLFQKGKMEWDQDIVINSQQALETLVRVGMRVGRATSY
ncbi:8151_t:CDS:10 [Ambispora gerdemannii]|uniref:Phosphatidylserine decarboxylase proenzyme 2 n=1 Tax=Ambispora gerdemannii TaxID=144530 RepID=A0A9N9CEF2_9GLOM|nr:8151_t:CDS:10 [Ambispora gerdemannii]